MTAQCCTLWTHQVAKKHKARAHWATATLVRRFSCRNVDLWPRNGQTGQKRAKKVQIFDSTGPRRSSVAHCGHTEWPKNTKLDPTRLHQLQSGIYLAATWIYDPKTAKIDQKMTQKLRKGAQRVPIWIKLSIFWVFCLIGPKYWQHVWFAETIESE